MGSGWYSPLLAVAFRTHVKHFSVRREAKQQTFLPSQVLLPAKQTRDRARTRHRCALSLLPGPWHLVTCNRLFPSCSETKRMETTYSIVRG